MKPINASAEPARAEPTATPEPAGVNAIDLSSLDRLAGIRQEKVRIDGYRARAEEMKAEVSETVYTRVIDDYGRRSTALDQQSAPLRAHARIQYSKLKALLDELESRHEQARLQKEEIEFRHAVGELTDEELSEQLTAPQSVLDQCETERESLDATRGRFIDAFGSAEALEAKDPPARATAPARETAPLRGKPGAEPGPMGSLRQPPGSDVGVNRNRMPPPADSGSTMVMPNAGRRMTASAAEYAPRPLSPEDPPKDADDGATVMLASAAVVIVEPASQSRDVQLGAMNGIGQSADNQICLSSSGVSRKHAVIKSAPGGFAIKDLASEKGTFVNGQRVTERMLADGDTIEIGSVKFVFRMPWTGSPSASSGRASVRPGNR